MRYFEQSSKYKKTRYVEEQEQGEQAKPGFAITVKGYSPFENLRQLMDPYGVENNRDKWGVVTRLVHLADSNGPFELYQRTNPTHFKLETGAVVVGAMMPPGIGVVQERVEQTSSPWTPRGAPVDKVIIDPMTKETIGKVSRPGGDDVINDQWFILQFKIIWKDGSKASASGTSAPPTGSARR
jgi:hypothetical protein